MAATTRFMAATAMTISTKEIGNDCSLHGGEGNDFIRGEEDDDRLSGEAGHDILLGGEKTTISTAAPVGSRIRRRHRARYDKGRHGQ